MKASFKAMLVAAVAVIGLGSPVLAQKKMAKDTSKMAKSKMDHGKMAKMSKGKMGSKMSKSKMKKDTSKM